VNFLIKARTIQQKRRCAAPAPDKSDYGHVPAQYYTCPGSALLGTWLSGLNIDNLSNHVQLRLLRFDCGEISRATRIQLDFARSIHFSVED
jgi:hypothetical protein